MTDDITFCGSETCKNKKCFRHRSNIQDRTIPHSFSMFENTDTCPLYTKEMTEETQIREILECNLPQVKDEVIATIVTSILRVFNGGIENLKRPTGEWLWVGGDGDQIKWSCSKCGRGVKEQENFCPQCGKRMKVERGS